jgi:hypothetical protein
VKGSGPEPQGRSVVSYVVLCCAAGVQQSLTYGWGRGWDEAGHVGFPCLCLSSRGRCRLPCCAMQRLAVEDLAWGVDTTCQVVCAVCGHVTLISRLVVCC